MFITALMLTIGWSIGQIITHGLAISAWNPGTISYFMGVWTMYFFNILNNMNRKTKCN